jgi:hypothetical protein
MMDEMHMQRNEYGQVRSFGLLFASSYMWKNCESGHEDKSARTSSDSYFEGVGGEALSIPVGL